MVGLIISGLPASGKGTQCQKVASFYGLVHLDTGENLRQQMNQGTELGKLASDFIARGKLVPDALIKRLMEKMIGNHSPGQGFVFDGFPRNAVQARMLEDFGNAFNLKIKGMIFLEVAEEEIIRRIQIRAIETGRKDDQDLNIIRKRIEGQKRQLNDLETFYTGENKYFKVDGSASMEGVFRSIEKIIEDHNLTQ